MATTSSSESERREWQDLDQRWRNGIEEAFGCRDHHALKIEALEDLKQELRNYHTQDGTSTSGGYHQVSDVLTTALDNLLPFVKAVETASQWQRASQLIWIGVLALVEGSSRSFVVPPDMTNVVLELSDCFPPLFPLFDPENKIIYRFKSVQYGLQEILEVYLEYCTKLCAYCRRSSTESIPTNIQSFSSGPGQSLESVKARIDRHVSRLRDAVFTELRLQAAEMMRLIPPGVSDMPKPQQRLGEDSKVQFPVSTVNRPRNSAFVGRDDLLATLADQIGGSGRPSKKAKRSRGDSVSPKVPIMCVLHGIGGVGKTQIALEYYHKHRDEYDACFWVEAERDWTIASSFARIAERLDLLPRKTSDGDALDAQNKAIEEGRNWLQTTEHRWLLIFDNVESFADLSRYMANESRCDGAVIVTTQSPTVPAWMENVRINQVAVLNRTTAADCIFRYLDRDPRDEEEHEVACQLAEHVGCMPLAMATIGGYVKQSQLELAEFYENIKVKATLWVKAPAIQENSGYSRNLRTVFDKAFEDLEPATRELLNILAFLDPDSIPETIFASAIEERLFKFIHSKEDLYACYFELHGRQLIRRDTSGKDHFVTIHRVVQWNVLLSLSDDQDKRFECFKQAFEMVKSVLPKTNPLQTPEAEAWPPYALHGRQILELRNHCLWPDPPIRLPKTFAQNLSDMGTYMWFSGKLNEGEKALETAEQILDDDRAKSSDPLRANVYAMLGIITSYQGVRHRARSMDFRKRAYQSRREDIGRKPEHARSRDEKIQFWQMHSDMAYGYIQEEDFESTREMMEECYEQYQSWDKKEENIPFEYAKYYWLSAFCAMGDQQPETAIEKITRCLELMQLAAGEQHPMVQLVKFCLANLLWHTQDPIAQRKALEINRAVLAFRLELLGEFSQFTMESQSTCGKLCYDAGQIEEAEQYLQTCLERRKWAAWNEEGVTRAQFRYAKVLRARAAKEAAAGNDITAQKCIEDAEKREAEVAQTIERYRKDYEPYLFRSEDQEAHLDQMVSLWAGRFTGGLQLRLPSPTSTTSPSTV